MLLRESCGKLSGASPKNKQSQRRITAETICSMKATAALAGSEQAGHRRHLRLWMNADAAHDVVHRWPNFHRSCRNVDIGELLELVVHTRQLLLNVFRRVWDFFFDPGDVEKYTAMRTSPAFLDLAHDAAGDVVSCQQFGRAARLFITLTISPAFFFVVGRLMAISFRDVIKHESATFAVSQNAALTAYAFGHQDSRNARRPDHSCWMELHELHVHKVGTGVVCQRVPIACIFPTVTCDLVGTADSAGCQNNGLCLKQQKPAALAVITKSSDNTISIFQEGENRALYFFQAEDGIRDLTVTGVQTCALPISCGSWPLPTRTCRRRSRRGGSERTCSIGSTSCPSRCRRCARGAPTSRNSSRIS